MCIQQQKAQKKLLMGVSIEIYFAHIEAEKILQDFF